MKSLFFRFGIIFKMLWDYIKGDYKDLSLTGLITIIVSVVYLIFPLDFIPDFIPVAGQADDILVMSIAYMILDKDIEKYKNWKNNRK